MKEGSIGVKASSISAVHCGKRRRRFLKRFPLNINFMHDEFIGTMIMIRAQNVRIVKNV
jgi:hypothetical protein